MNKIINRSISAGILLVVSLIVICLVAPITTKAGQEQIGWRWIQFGGDERSIFALAISPNYATDHTIFAGTDGGGVFKFPDEEGGWSTVLTDLSVYSLAISPNYATDSTIFAGTDRRGIFKSTNGGGIWKPVNNGLPQDPEEGYPRVTALAISPDYVNDKTIFAGTRQKKEDLVEGTIIYKSTTGGEKWDTGEEGWKKVKEIDHHVLYALAISPNYYEYHVPEDGHDQTIFAGIVAGDVSKSTIYKSTTGGEKWDTGEEGWKEVKEIDHHVLYALAISPDYYEYHVPEDGHDQTIFAGIVEGTKVDLGGVFKFPDEKGGCSAVLTHLSVYSLAISPNYATDNTIFAGTVGEVYKSINEGGIWKPVNNGLPQDSEEGYLRVAALAITPDGQTIFAGVWYTDPAKGFTHLHH